MSAAMVKNPAEAATVMPGSSYDQAQPALPLTTNMTATSLTSGGNSCLDEQIERLKRCEYLREGEVKALCLRGREILVDESNVQRVDAPVTVRICDFCLCLVWIWMLTRGCFWFWELVFRYVVISMASFMTL